MLSISSAGLHSVGNIQEAGVEGGSTGSCIQDIWGPIFVVLCLAALVIQAGAACVEHSVLRDPQGQERLQSGKAEASAQDGEK